MNKIFYPDQQIFYCLLLGVVDFKSRGQHTVNYKNGKAYAGILYFEGKPVCDDSFDSNDAKVACKSIGYSGYHSFHSDSFNSIGN